MFKLLTVLAQLGPHDRDRLKDLLFFVCRLLLSSFLISQRAESVRVPSGAAKQRGEREAAPEL